MTTQVLIYERAVPISSDRHGNWSVTGSNGYSFARNINAVPLLASEFINAAVDGTIVFAGEGEDVFPSLILGVRSTNEMIDENGVWHGSYVPAFLRRYPFIFSHDEEAGTFTLCIDEEFDGINDAGRGERLFDSDGERTQYLNNMLQFVTDYQTMFERTKLFCQRLVQLGVLESGVAQFNLPQGERASLGGLSTINREKLKAIDTETLQTMLSTDELELCFVHLQSLNNLTSIAEKSVNSSAADSAAPSKEDAVASKPAAKTSKKSS